jgi:hypothetical protein
MYVSVRRKTLANNKRLNRKRPVFDVRTDKAGRPTRVHSATYHGHIRLVYDPANPLASSAVAWVEIDETPAPAAQTEKKG